MSNTPEMSNVAAVHDGLLAQLNTVLKSYETLLAHYVSSTSKSHTETVAECAKVLNDLEQRADTLRAKILEFS